MNAKKVYVLILVFITANYYLIANDLQINNIVLLDKNSVTDIVTVQFDISWENSWRVSTNPSNWDAAWIFIKYRVGNGEWSHASLSTISSEHYAPDGARIDAVNDGRGVFLYRSVDGSGNNNWQGVKLRWNYGLDDVPDNTNALQIKVFGFEMVYVPQGSFYVGDGKTFGSFWDASKSFTEPAFISTEPVVIRSDTSTHDAYRDDEQILLTGILVDGDTGIDTDGTTSVDNTEYPTGYKAFYCMRYEITMQQYADYLNTLTRVQQNNHIIPDIFDVDDTSHFALVIGGWEHPARNSICYSTPHDDIINPVYFYCDLNNNKIPNEPNDGQNIACGNIDWFDGAAYSDWAALRPMTELEFEKACRGPEVPVPSDYAWNSKIIVLEEYTLENAGTENEIVQNPGTGTFGNCSHDLTTGHHSVLDSPLRVGIFATENSTRTNSGASYYGIMELTGNIQERTVALGIPEGRTYRGTNGDGVLTESGNATNLDWPGIVQGEETDGVKITLGSGNRGGDWNDGRSFVHIASRLWSSFDPFGRNIGAGFRCVRSAE